MVVCIIFDRKYCPGKYLETNRHVSQLKSKFATVLVLFYALGGHYWSCYVNTNYSCYTISVELHHKKTDYTCKILFLLQ
jgi:hypothetical protein